MYTYTAARTGLEPPGLPPMDRGFVLPVIVQTNARNPAHAGENRGRSGSRSEMTWENL